MIRNILKKKYTNSWGDVFLAQIPPEDRAALSQGRIDSFLTQIPPKDRATLSQIAKKYPQYIIEDRPPGRYTGDTRQVFQQAKLCRAIKILEIENNTFEIALSDFELFSPCTQKELLKYFPNMLTDQEKTSQFIGNGCAGMAYDERQQILSLIKKDALHVTLKKFIQESYLLLNETEIETLRTFFQLQKVTDKDILIDCINSATTAQIESLFQTHILHIKKRIQKNTAFK